MSTGLFNLVIYWIMRRTTEDTVRGIRWTIYLTWKNWIINSQIQQTTRRLIIFAKQVALDNSVKKTDVMALNATNSPVQVENEDIHYTENFISKRHSSPKTFNYL